MNTKTPCCDKIKKYFDLEKIKNITAVLAFILAVYGISQLIKKVI
jgi:hypothetical protein